MPTKPSNSTIDLLIVSARARHARHVLTGFAISTPTLSDLWRQIDEALSDVLVLTVEVTRIRAQLAAVRLGRADLAAAGRATIAAYGDGETDPFAYLRDELDAQGFGGDRGSA